MSKSKYSPKTNVEAVDLRKRGRSYREIGKELNVSKSTIKYWCIGVPLKSKNRKRFREVVRSINIP